MDEGPPNIAISSTEFSHHVQNGTSVGKGELVSTAEAVGQYPSFGSTSQRLHEQENTQQLLDELVGAYDPKAMDLIQSGEFSSSVDIERYLYNVPFHRLYDD